MITTLLLDLDDTLLGNPNAAFLPAYFAALAKGLAAFMPPDQLLAGVRGATQAMLANRDPARTLQEVFETRFEELTGRALAGTRGLAGEFYRTDYADLEQHTEFRPAAPELAAWALGEGLEVGIATNPVYPLTAIEQRLAWAGVSPADYSLAIIPSFETARYGKPQPEYYAELIARLGRRPDEALMVGDDWQNDMTAAAVAGLNTFWITPDGPRAQLPAGGPRPDGLGTLDDFLYWARDARCLETLQARPPTPAALLAGLNGNLAAFYGLAAGVGDWRRQPAEGEWSLTEVLCHLRDAEIEVNVPRLERIAGEAEPFVPAADTDPWARERNYQAQDGPAALRDFAAARMEAVSFLQQQPEAYWERQARHSILGRTTPSELVAFTLEHDRIHLMQIKAL